MAGCLPLLRISHHRLSRSLLLRFAPPESLYECLYRALGLTASFFSYPDSGDHGDHVDGVRAALPGLDKERGVLVA